MPAFITPPDMPEGVVIAIETMGSRARTEILRALLTAGRALTRQEIVELSSVAAHSARAHLLAMELVGLVSADVPPQRRPGRTVHWVADRRRAEELARTWLDYLSTEHPGGKARPSGDTGT